MARYLEDLDLLLETFAASFSGQQDSCRGRAGGPFKIAFSQELLKMSPEPSMQQLFGTFRSRLATKGHCVTEAQPALDFDELYHDWGMIAGHEYSKLIPGILKNSFTTRAWAWWILDRRLGSGPFTEHFKRGMLSTETEYQQACENRKAIFDVLDGFFRKYDFWILPVAPSSAIPRSLCGRRIKTPNGLVEYSRYLGSYIVPTTTLGTPVLTYPIGFDDAKMPVAVQIYGPRYSDRWLVRSAARLEQ
jgi:Asp-tRNA(Asn)/Glu-tRNA(Gln) amidotransferase A subunit family amidase